MKKILAGVLLAVAVGLVFPCRAFARPIHDGEFQRKLDRWFSGIGQDMDRAGQGFAKVFSNHPDSDD